MWRIEINLIVHNGRQKEWIIKISLRFYSEDQQKLVNNFNQANFSPAIKNIKPSTWLPLYEIFETMSCFYYERHENKSD